METVRFTTRPDGYGCNKPGDMSGEYVPAEVARDLLDALDVATGMLRLMGVPMEGHDEGLKIHAALAKARGK